MRLLWNLYLSRYVIQFAEWRSAPKMQRQRARIRGRPITSVKSSASGSLMRIQNAFRKQPSKTLRRPSSFTKDQVKRRSVVRVKNILGDDVYGRWLIEKIVVQKDGQRYAIIPDKKAFGTKAEAEYYAHTRTQRFVERKIRNEKSARWRTVSRFLFTCTLIPVLTAVAVQWRRSLAAY